MTPNAKRQSLILVLFIVAIATKAQPDFHPDYFGEALKDAIGYIENRGQVKNTNEVLVPDVLYYTQGAKPRAYFQRKGLVSYVLAKRDTSIAVPDTLYRLDMKCVGPNVQDVAPTAYIVKPYTQSFYTSWTGDGVENVNGYSRLVYEDIYPGIDLHFYTGPYGQKMAFVCHPGSSPDNIKLQFAGHDGIAIDWDGALRLLFNGHWIRFNEAIAYQYDAGNNVSQLGWTASYGLDSLLSISNFTFDTFDPDLPLVLQIGPPPGGGGGPIETPGLCWSTYFGGDQSDVITSSTQDAQSNYFVAGRTGSGELEFPAAPGTFAYPNTGGNLAFLVKMDDQDRMMWRAFLGGEGGDITIANAVVAKDNTSTPMVYIAGSTNSNTLSTWANGSAYFNGSSTNTTFKGFIASFDNSDVLPTSLRLWTTYIGDSDVQIHGMAKDASERLFLTGQTLGSLPPEQETAPSGSEHYPYVDGLDAFIILLNEDDRTLWVTPYGGSGDDKAKEVVVGDGKMVIAGDTESADIITVDGGSNAWDREFAGEIRECFVAEFDLSGHQQWGTCLAADQDGSPTIMDMFGKGLAIDPVTQDIIIGGSLFSQGLLIVEGPGWYDNTALPGVQNSFLARFSGTDRSLTWSTYLAGSNAAFMNEVRTLYFDGIGNLYVAGRTRDLSLPLTPLEDLYYTNLIQADVVAVDPGPPPTAIVEASDMFVMSFTPDHWLAWCSYIGGQAGTLHELPHTLLRRNSDLYVAGFTSKHTVHFDGFNFTSFFPLHDTQVPGVHFTDTYGDVPNFEGNGTSDAFITRVCASALTSTGERPTSFSAGLLARLEGGRIALAGLPLGPHEVAIHDASGRVVQRARVVSDGSKALFPCPVVSEGVYFVTVMQLGLAAKLHITR
ncbi:MAG: hypothetical protein IPM12_00105 [Flavobacteriales bacterium]|nr:hypothetical protein [Flavobacteriales bacterium]